MRISDWSSDVCSSDLLAPPLTLSSARRSCCAIPLRSSGAALATVGCAAAARIPEDRHQKTAAGCLPSALPPALRSEEHTSELQSLMRISYAVFCLKKKTYTKHNATTATRLESKHIYA